MPMIAEVMASAGLEFEQIECFAVTVGPGSFTGVRVGVAAARAFALAAAQTGRRHFQPRGDRCARAPVYSARAATAAR